VNERLNKFDLIYFSTKLELSQDTSQFFVKSRWSAQGHIQKFFEGGVLKFFCIDGKISGGGGLDFFLKNPSKFKKIPKKEGGGFDPQNASLNTPLGQLNRNFTRFFTSTQSLKRGDGKNFFSRTI